jgi:(1->4)-alpha-D-glucan 1-alpha-D-glucosylmutase
MNASSTHDTKRSEDVRARINVLSEMPDAWAARVRRWAEMNARHKAQEDGNAIPDANDEYLLYQTLLGALPLGELDEAKHTEFVGRIRQYMEKATREAKIHTSWISPNEAYDAGTAAFVEGVLRRDGEFVEELTQLHRIIARLGMVNSLAQTLLKLACPGVPDIYQGQELWDFSLVDPDNRRPVDYALRQGMLDGLVEWDGVAGELLAGWEDGRIKLFITHRTLRLRRERPNLFAKGDYLPLRASGRRAEHVVAFARRAGAQCVVAIVPRLVATLTEASGYAFPSPAVWADTQVSGDVPPGRYRDVFTGAEMDVTEGIAIADLLGSFPVALLDKLV